MTLNATTSTSESSSESSSESTSTLVPNSIDLPLTIVQWLERYERNGVSPRTLLTQWLAIDRTGDVAWIYRASLEDLKPQLDYLEGHSPQDLPLFGVPFVVKDNIDVKGWPTTAACPAFAYTAQSHAAVVQALQAAGAVCVGKTNMDQFATGLVGTRSPFGAVPNSFNPEYVSGGSSSGSAVLVARGVVPFSLGTDTAGSGRVPAGLNNIVGFKPSPGSVPMAGVVPACRSLDVVSIFALTALDASRVMSCMKSAGDEPLFQPYTAQVGWFPQPQGHMRVGIPKTSYCDPSLGFDQSHAQSLEHAKALGFELVEVDMGLFFEAAALLYDGAFVAERFAAIEPMVKLHAQQMDPVVRQVIEGAQKYSAVDAFKARYRVEEIRQEIQGVWQNLDALMVPTVVTCPSMKAVALDPIGKNSELGRFTNFVNFLGQAAVACPSGIASSGLPFGVTFIAPNGYDRALLELAHLWERNWVHTLGSTGSPVSNSEGTLSLAAPQPHSAPTLLLAVVGAHLSGMPLNGQLIERGARLVSTTRTSANYQLYELAATSPRKPGLFRAQEGGVNIELEVYEMALSQLGSFLTLIPAPLGLGQVELESGQWVHGFICEGVAQSSAKNISEHGGWRHYLSSLDA